eukprot:CAMPEP_0118890160 /NCGR_PEP_ID=MMETSP1166-20130328/754_1 /TAXON_ID=1104430 /ORGANISM="Chrysoreinhardia sp, Strain CCMP3193" /LENGTH=366 /DNA_ID=CAMNT_0006828763 /DNA_START=85 /DNA_END=1185 /DNA_ORIENTATION=+
MSSSFKYVPRMSEEGRKDQSLAQNSLSRSLFFRDDGWMDGWPMWIGSACLFLFVPTVRWLGFGVDFAVLPVFEDGGVEVHGEGLALGGPLVELADGGDDFAGLLDVEGVEVGAYVGFDVLDHRPDVGEVWFGVVEGAGLRGGAGEGAAQVGVADLLLLDAHGEHDGGRQLVGRAGAVLGDFDDVDRVPGAVGDEAVAGDGLLDEEAPREAPFSGAPLEVPEVDRRRAPLEVELAVGVEQLVRLDLELPQVRRRHEAVVEGRLVAIRPRRPVRVPVAVVVAQQVLEPRLRVRRLLQRLVHALQQLVRVLRHEVQQTTQIVLDLVRRHPTHDRQRTRNQVLLRHKSPKDRSNDRDGRISLLPSSSEDT